MQPVVMRTVVILLTSLLIAAAAVSQVEDGEQTLRLLLHDIPAEDLTSASPDDSHTDIEALLDEEEAAPQASPRQCQQSCVAGGTTLDAVCERHVRVEAPRSRAVCYTRVDERRTRCLASCGD
ncbi:hypothetical protein [Brevundimonas sp.]|uniref:hypothetical protein n=1 Tax=Brevundimonas sp. TaxID=1871086 RepID=UPI003F6EE847